MDHMVDNFRSIRLWTKEDNYRILQAALSDLSDALSRPSEDDTVKALCRKHLDRLAFYRYLVYHFPMEDADTEPDMCPVESEILMKDIDSLLEGRPPFDTKTLTSIHKLDKRLDSILDEE